MKENKIAQGIFLAVLATIIWSGNFVVARGIFKQVNPVTLSFFRWGCATVLFFPFAFKKFKSDWPQIRQHLGYFFWIALFGISLFNTFVYVGGRYTSAINLALIGTTTSPVMSNILARVFLKEKIGVMKIAGMILCIIGVLFLITHGDFSNLLTLQFSQGDGWVLLAAFAFAMYNTLVKKKPQGIDSISFLFAVILVGTVLLIPFFIWEQHIYPPVVWDMNLVWIIIYLGAGASVISFLIWNKAIAILGAGRTSLFGNLIPVFSSLEAMLFLHEDFTMVHVISAILVLAGLIVANFNSLNTSK